MNKENILLRFSLIHCLVLSLFHLFRVVFTTPLEMGDERDAFGREPRRHSHQHASSGHRNKERRSSSRDFDRRPLRDDRHSSSRHHTDRHNDRHTGHLDRHTDRRHNDRHTGQLDRRQRDSRSPVRRRRRSRSPTRHSPAVHDLLKRDPTSSSKEDNAVEEGALIKEKEELDEEAQMRALMGFGGFETTKGKAVPGKDVGAASARKEVQLTHIPRPPYSLPIRVDQIQAVHEQKNAESNGSSGSARR